MIALLLACPRDLRFENPLLVDLALMTSVSELMTKQSFCPTHWTCSKNYLKALPSAQPSTAVCTPSQRQLPFSSSPRQISCVRFVAWCDFVVFSGSRLLGRPCARKPFPSTNLETSTRAWGHIPHSEDHCYQISSAKE